jgi:hypothetical protein
MAVLLVSAGAVNTNDKVPLLFLGMLGALSRLKSGDWFREAPQLTTWQIDAISKLL